MKTAIKRFITLSAVVVLCVFSLVLNAIICLTIYSWVVKTWFSHGM